MQPTSYTMTFSAKEKEALTFALEATFRDALLFALRFQDATLVPEGFLSAAEYLQLTKRVMTAHPDAQATRQQSGTAAAAAIASPAPAKFPAQTPPQSSSPEIRDRWAHDKSGAEAVKPEGCYEICVNVVKIEDAPPRNNASTPRKKVTWEVPPSSGGKGFADAFCWDAALFPYLANRVKQLTTLYITRSKDNKYTNVVGVRA